MTQTRLLVTGSTGFIGRYLLEQLIQKENILVTAVVRPGAAADGERSRDNRSSRIKLVAADLSNPYGVRLPLDEYDVLINLVGSRSRLDDAQWRANVEYVRDLLILARRISVKRIVHFSSVGVYGLPETSTLVTESSSLAPRDWYATTKVLGDQMLENFHRETRVPVVILRPSWVVGYGSHLLDKHLFRAFSSGIKIVMRLATPLNIVYVKDVADAAILAALDHKKGLRVYNINAVERWSFNDFLREIDLATGGPKVPLFIPRAMVGILARRFLSLRVILSNVFFSANRAADELGFVPKYDLAAITEEILAMRSAARVTPIARSHFENLP